MMTESCACKKKAESWVFSSGGVENKLGGTAYSGSPSEGAIPVENSILGAQDSTALKLGPPKHRHAMLSEPSLRCGLAPLPGYLHSTYRPHSGAFGPVIKASKELKFDEGPNLRYLPKPIKMRCPI